MGKIDKWIMTIRGMYFVTALAVVVVIANPLLPWGLQVGGKDWWAAFAGLVAGLVRFWYVAIREHRASSCDSDAPLVE